MQRTTPPFRSEINGSFLRPQCIKDARADFEAGRITSAEKDAIEEREVAKLVAQEEAIGLPVVSDGEFRREWWHLDFLAGLTGVQKYEAERGYQFHGGVVTKPHNVKVVGKIDFPDDHPFLNHCKYLQSVTKNAVCKFTIPSPLLLCHPAIMNKEVYPNDQDFYDDLGKTYKKALNAFYAIGLRYLQVDDTVWTALCDEGCRQLYIDNGIDVQEMLKQWAAIFNHFLSDKPADLTVSMHACRGNYKSTYFCSGSYDFVAPILFGTVNLDAFFLEYDDERSGTFEPLKHIKNQFVVLGVFTSKSGKLEDKELIKARVAEAAKYVPLEQLCISTQCGFASTEDGNCLTEEEQWNKLKYIIEISKEIWK
ncbi:5-methyltetrahydropteroyltriglutamate/homocysteine S-methyltransferase [Tritrichomonas foetus]|uniref:5-methyltetrahydropteroyltriglutamate/homocysteine S-methyltransferase n=1 Tax=Tritrichomonas foetus TaxID=1144522 RepID=A0A1J4KRK8_9EUKA|nr:5-methyltetrahydropteroyltriglutamate/homocysteine S-methyltransferase [Tritrichomonas foetus]|eukprot:OHT13891.1 5-methyltetrahydropteroyltriglutamate/homocysteine S-methyltransferase [Tritrichomonas foetus]